VADLSGHGTFDEAAYSDGLEPTDFDGYATFDLSAYSGGLEPVDFDGHATPSETAYEDESVEDQPTSPQWRYHMRGWNPSTSQFEYWLARHRPSLTPPSGQVVLEVTVVGRWEV
jgi:hypothetical protein